MITSSRKLPSLNIRIAPVYFLVEEIIDSMTDGREAPIRISHCYASGRDGDWEGICSDLDIAVQGCSFEEVARSLHDAVSLYLESVSSLPDGQQAHLLHRPAPVTVRLQFLGCALRSLIGLDGGDRYHHHFTMPLAA